MTNIFRNLVAHHTSTTGTGNITLGSPLDGYTEFDGSLIESGFSVNYLIRQGTSWELGVGRYQHSGVIERNIVPGEFESSTGSKINLQAGGSVIYLGNVNAADLYAFRNQITVLEGYFSAAVADGAYQFASGDELTITDGIVTAFSPGGSGTFSSIQLGGVDLDGRIDDIEADVNTHGSDISMLETFQAITEAIFAAAIADGTYETAGGDQVTTSDGVITGFTQGNGNPAPITSDLSIYIDPTSGNDSNDGLSSGNPVATFDKAFEVAGGYYAAGGNKIYIVVLDGDHSVDTIEPSHPQLSEVEITGETELSTTLSSVQSSSGSSGNRSIVLNVASVTGISAGDYALIRGTASGTYPANLSGCWEITNVDAGNTRITVNTTIRGAQVPSGAITGTVDVLKSVLTINASQDGVVIRSGRFGVTLSNLVVVGNGDTGYHCLLLEPGSSCTLSDVGISQGWRNIRVNAGSILNATSCASCSSTADGLLNLGGSVDAQYFIASGNGSIGVTNYSHFFGANGDYSGNVLDGLFSYNGGRILAATSRLQSNQRYGCNTSAVSSSLLSSATLANNATLDAYAEFNSICNLTSASYGSISPALNTFGNNGSYNIG